MNPVSSYATTLTKPLSDTAICHVAGCNEPVRHQYPMTNPTTGRASATVSVCSGCLTRLLVH